MPGPIAFDFKATGTACGDERPMTKDQGTTTAFDDLDATLRERGPEAALEQLETILAGRGEFRALLDALLLRARREVGLPLIQDGSLSDIPEPARTQYEDRYVNAIRDVGARLLFRGEVA